MVIPVEWLERKGEVDRRAPGAASTGIWNWPLRQTDGSPVASPVDRARPRSIAEDRGVGRAVRACGIEPATSVDEDEAERRVEDE